MVSLRSDHHSFLPASSPPACPPDADIRVEVGEPREYERFAHVHYRGGAPATLACVLVAREGATGAVHGVARGAPLGVLVASFPTPNGAWRCAAWPDLVRDGRIPVAVLNREVRTISRVVTDPRARGRGVAHALLRAYLAKPQSPRTEALAALPSARQVFMAAGFREVERTRPRPDPLDPVRRALRARGCPPWRALDLSEARRLVSLPDVLTPLLVWARSSRATRGMAQHADPEGESPADAVRMAGALLLARAAGQMLAVPRVFVTP
jgi:GNAT superfamily N-acetyltransferase